MGSIRVLIDFGSTFTKVVAVDLESEEILSSAQVPSTVDTDITAGLEEALERITADVRIGELEKRQALACSSAAGGLRMVCVGFVPDLTSEAAKRSALGAGAKVVGLYSYELTRQALAELEATSPDIVLLSGGTDGGDKKVIIHNARKLSRCSQAISNIVVAGNNTTYDQIRSIFENSGKQVSFAGNVMPEIGKLDIGPSNRSIRDVFLKRIIEAKGLDKAKTMIQDVIMPTPSAVLEGAKLLAEGVDDIPGFGELLLVDVGGATTDVHSISEGRANPGAFMRVGLPEPYVKRTVEGDLGLKYSIDTLLVLAREKESPPNLDKTSNILEQGTFPESEDAILCHTFLTCVAVDTAVKRHVGRMEVMYGPAGEILVQQGKDLTQVQCVVGTGGPIAYSRNPREVLKGVLFQDDDPAVLRPKEPKFFLDKQYIFYAVGLLSQSEPRKALSLMKKHLIQV